MQECQECGCGLRVKQCRVKLADHPLELSGCWLEWSWEFDLLTEMVGVFDLKFDL